MVGIETVSSQLITLDMNRSPHRDIGRSGQVEDARSIEDTLNRPRSSSSSQYVLDFFFSLLPYDLISTCQYSVASPLVTVL
jgi:hypothetical protein